MKKNIKDLKYPDVIHITSQEDYDKLKGVILKEYDKEYNYYLAEGRGCSKNDEYYKKNKEKGIPYNILEISDIMFSEKEKEPELIEGNWYEGTSEGRVWLFKFKTKGNCIHTHKSISLDSKQKFYDGLNPYKNIKPANMEEVYQFFPEEKPKEEVLKIGDYITVTDLEATQPFIMVGKITVVEEGSDNTYTRGKVDFISISSNNQHKGEFGLNSKWSYKNIYKRKWEKSSFSDRQWLDKCISANKFIPKEEVLKSSTPKFEVGKWYKDINHKPFLYIKFQEIYSETELFSSEKISGDGICKSIRNDNWLSGGHRNWVLLTNLSEIQSYLPEGHPDKFYKTVADPVKQELTSLPEKWCIKAPSKSENPEQYAKLSSWRTSKDYTDSGYLMYAGYNGYSAVGYHVSTKPSDCIEITYEQFLKWVVNKEQSMQKNEEDLTGRYLKALVDGPQSIGGMKKGEFLKIINEYDGSWDNKNTWYWNRQSIGTRWELMPIGFEPPTKRPEYIECTNGYHGSEVGVIYKWDGSWIVYKTNRTAMNQEWHKNGALKWFKASTKQAYEEQDKPKQSMESILAEARKKYPIGTIVNSLVSRYKNCRITDHTLIGTGIWFPGALIDEGNRKINVQLYDPDTNQWAEILSTPNESELDEWLRETKAMNLSLDQLTNRVNYSCNFDTVYNQLKGEYAEEKAKILHEKWYGAKGENVWGIETLNKIHEQLNSVYKHPYTPTECYLKHPKVVDNQEPVLIKQKPKIKLIQL